jgi:hypothetical protein
MVHPTKTINRKAKLGFCSLIIKARKVATRAKLTIFRISILGPPFLIDTKIRILFFGRGHPQSWPPEIKYR